jgi:hypothetical protein
MAAKSKPVDEVTVADLGIDAGASAGPAPARRSSRSRTPRPRGRRDHRGRRRGLRQDRRVPRRAQGHLRRRRRTTWLFPRSGCSPRPTTARSPPSPSSCSPRPASSATPSRRSTPATAPTPSPAARRPRRHQGASRHRRPRRRSSRACPSPRPSPPPSRRRRPRPAILFGTTYDGRDVAGRLSVKLDKPVITNNVDLELDGDSLVGTEPVFGGTTNVKTKFTAGGPGICLVRPKSFAAEESGGGAAEVEPSTVPDGCHRRRQAHRPPRRGAPGPEARRGRRRRLRRSWPGRGREVRDDRGPGQAPQGAPPAPPAPSSTPAGCPTATRSARPARS